jgi:hypothetical protein
MKFSIQKENFVAITPNLQSLVTENQNQFNSLVGLMNPFNPAVVYSPNSQANSILTTGTSEATGTSKQAAFEVTSLSTDLRYPSQKVDMNRLVNICESVKSADCSAFDKSDFNKYCGMSFDSINGKDSQGKGHVGGLFVDPNAKFGILNGSTKPSIKVMQPTIGQADLGKFSLDKASCIKVKETVECQQKRSFDSPNCKQCYLDNTWIRVDPQTDMIYTSVFGSGSGILTYPSGEKVTLTESFQNLSRPDFYVAAGNEQTVQIESVDGKTPPKFSGYTISNIPNNNTFTVDLFYLVQKDLQTGKKANTQGSVKNPANSNQKLVVIIPGYRQKTMRLQLFFPFSYVATDSEDAQDCLSGPIIWDKKAADILASDPCFGPNAKPGQYSLECLQQMWMASGGQVSGTGYPSNPAAASKLNFDEKTGGARSIGDIGDYLYEENIRAQTGRTSAGSRLSINDWNASSMYILGIPRTNPCSGQDDLPISEVSIDCKAYIYANGGNGKDFGKTYNAEPKYSSGVEFFVDANAFQGNGGMTFCIPGTTADPNTSSGASQANQFGGISSLRAFYDNLSLQATNNNLSAADRYGAVNQCYNVSLVPTPSPEVYWAQPNGQGYTVEYKDAVNVAKSLGGQLATLSQLKIAWTLGADWCSTGWVADGPEAFYPINSSVKPGCAIYPGIESYIHPSNGKLYAGVLVYGLKPTQDSEIAKKYDIKPFNDSQWNYGEVFAVRGGQPSDFGAQPATPEQLRKCQLLGMDPIPSGMVAAYGVKPSVNQPFTVPGGSKNYKPNMTQNDMAIAMPFNSASMVYSVFDLQIPQPPEVYVVGGGQSKWYDFTRSQAEQVAADLGGQLATYEQVKNAWKQNGNWCFAGWCKDFKTLAVWPLNAEIANRYPGTDAARWCNGTALVRWPYKKAGVLVYGVKPQRNSPLATKYHINPHHWIWNLALDNDTKNMDQKFAQSLYFNPLTYNLNNQNLDWWKTRVVTETGYGGEIKRSPESSYPQSGNEANSFQFSCWPGQYITAWRPTVNTYLASLDARCSNGIVIGPGQSTPNGGNWIESKDGFNEVAGFGGVSGLWQTVFKWRGQARTPPLGSATDTTRAWGLRVNSDPDGKPGKITGFWGTMDTNDRWINTIGIEGTNDSQFIKTGPAEKKVNLDYRGADYRYIGNSSYEECASECSTDPSCRSFTFAGSWSGCYLKNSEPSLYTYENGKGVVSSKKLSSNDPIRNFTHLGCFRDNESRYLPVRGPDYRGSGLATNLMIEGAYDWARKNGYQYFSVQNGGETYAGTLTDFAMAYGGDSNKLPEGQQHQGECPNTSGCSYLGIGGCWTQNVYRIDDSALFGESQQGYFEIIKTGQIRIGDVGMPPGFISVGPDITLVSTRLIQPPANNLQAGSKLDKIATEVNNGATNKYMISLVSNNGIRASYTIKKVVYQSDYANRYFYGFRGDSAATGNLQQRFSGAQTIAMTIIVGQ